MGQWISGTELIKRFEAFAPKSLAYDKEDEDRLGLQVGTLNKPVKKVMLTLDVLENTVDEAIKQEVDLIFAHHAMIFRPVRAVKTDSGTGKLIEKLIKHDISLYVAHTNLDIAEGGINDQLIKQLGLKPNGSIVPVHQEKLLKFAVFTPESHVDGLRKALGDAGAGALGDYSYCSFSSEGTGQFMPGADADPYIGSRNELEQVNENRVETILPESLLPEVMAAMKSAHPYEEPAYDIIPLKNEGIVHGLGRIAETEEDLTVEEWAGRLKEVFDLDGVRVIGDHKKQVKKIGVIGGDGNDFLFQAKKSGIDVLITGDIYYHTAHLAMELGLTVIDAGHYIEKSAVKGLEEAFINWIKESGAKTEVHFSVADTNPFKYM